MNSIVTKFVTTLLHPWQAMNMVKLEGEDASIAPAMIYVTVMGFISGIITAAYSYFLPSAAIPNAPRWTALLAIIELPAVAFIGSFIGTFIVWGLIDGWLKGTGPQYKTNYRMLALLATFSPLSSLVGPIPKIGQYLLIAVNIWGTIVMIRGILIVRDTPKVRTWVVCLSLFVFLFAVGLLARVVAQQQLRSGNGLGTIGAAPDANLDVASPSEDLGETSDNLDQELQDLADKAKAAPKAESTPKK
jgi:hypothetical protein